MSSGSFEVMNPASRRDYRAALIDAYNAVGVRRPMALAKLKEIGSDFAFSVRYDRAVVDFTGTGVELKKGDRAQLDKDVETESDSTEKHARNFNLKDDRPGAAWGNKKIGPVIIPCGVCVLVAGGGAGKTPLAHELAGYGGNPYATVRVGEPLSGYTASNYVAAHGLGSAMFEHSDIVLDSIKDLLSSGGNLMKSGLSRGALTEISAWSMLACDMGVTIYIPVNPSTPDPEVKELLAEAMRSNATTAMIHRDGDVWDYFIRTGEGLNRMSGSFSTTWDKGQIGLSFAGRKPAEMREDEVFMKITSRITDWDNIVRRSVVQQNDE